MGKPNVNINVGGAANGTQTYKTVVLKPNIPFAHQLGSEDTIYVIKWDYDLGGEEVTVPANCVLKFEGGSLSNGVLIGQNTTILEQDGVMKNITIGFNSEKAFTNSEFHVSTFSLGKNQEDAANNDNIIASLVEYCNAAVKDIIVDKNIFLSNGIALTGARLDCKKRIYFTGLNDAVAISINDSSHQRRHSVYTINIQNHDVDNSVLLEDFINMNVIGVEVKDSDTLVFENCEMQGFTIGLKLSGLTDVGCANNYFEDINTRNCYIGIQFYKDGGFVNENSFVKGHITCYSAFCCFNKNIAFDFQQDNSVNAFNNNVFKEYNIESSGIGIRCNATTLYNVFDNMRVEAVVTLVEEGEQCEYVTFSRKSIIRPYNQSQNKNIYKGFVVLNKVQSYPSYSGTIRYVTSEITGGGYVTFNTKGTPVEIEYEEEDTEQLYPIGERDGSGLKLPTPITVIVPQSKCVSFRVRQPMVVGKCSAILRVYGKETIDGEYTDLTGIKSPDEGMIVGGSGTSSHRMFRGFRSANNARVTTNPTKNPVVVGDDIYYDVCLYDIPNNVNYIDVKFENPGYEWHLVQYSEFDIINNCTKNYYEVMNTPSKSNYPFESLVIKHPVYGIIEWTGVNWSHQYISAGTLRKDHNDEIIIKNAFRFVGRILLVYSLTVSATIALLIKFNEVETVDEDEDIGVSFAKSGNDLVLTNTDTSTARNVRYRWADNKNPALEFEFVEDE